jgi:hypothetical protein
MRMKRMSRKEKRSIKGVGGSSVFYMRREKWVCVSKNG